MRGMSSSTIETSSPRNADRGHAVRPSARHALSDQQGFELLRGHSQRTGRKLYDVAAAILDSHLLLSPHPAAQHAPEPEAAAP